MGKENEEKDWVPIKAITSRENVTKEQREWSAPHVILLLQIEHRQSVYCDRFQILRFFTRKSLFSMGISLESK